MQISLYPVYETQLIQPYFFSKNDLNEEDDWVNRNEKGEIEIFTSFYNGGWCFYEALEYNLNKLKRNETSRAEL